MSILLEDLLHEVLSFLPSKDLLRLRCVSKSWRALIDSPYFIQLHLNKSLKDSKSRKVLIVTGDRDEYFNMKYLFYAISVHPEFKFSIREVEPPTQNFSGLENFPGLEYVGSCRSLICLKLRHKIVVWNPSTRSHRILPYASTQGSNYGYYYIRYALGYDGAADDYKVVRFILERRSGDYGIQVYSLQSDTWKEIDKFPIRFQSISKPIHANGAIICCLQEYGDTGSWLLILPLRTQVLQLVSNHAGDSELKDFFSGLFRVCSCGCCYCDGKARDFLKLINNVKSDTLTDLLLSNSDINEGMDYPKELFHENLCSELGSLWRNLLRGVNFIYSNFVDSLFRVDRSNN